MYHITICHHDQNDRMCYTAHINRRSAATIFESVLRLHQGRNVTVRLIDSDNGRELECCHLPANTETQT